jgi:pimeloyl-ACP methyl ester carboxylesterase
MLDLRLPQQPELRLPRGNLLYRGLNSLVKALIPLDIDPTGDLLSPAANAAHTTREVVIPVGDHQTYGHLLLANEATGPTICIAHGTGAHTLLPYYFFIRAWLRAGFNVMHFELDGHGRNPRILRYPDLAQNVPAALDFLRAQPEIDPDRVGLVGVSLGGACALNAAARCESIGAVATISMPHSLHLDEVSPNRLLEFVTAPMRLCIDGACEWVDILDDRTLPAIRDVINGLDPLGSIVQLERTPVLVVGGAWDHQAPAWQAEDLFSLAPGPKELFIEPRRNHFTLMASRKAVQKTVDFFAEWL